MKLITYILSLIKELFGIKNKKVIDNAEDIRFEGLDPESVLRVSIGLERKEPEIQLITGNQEEITCIIRSELGLDCEQELSIDDIDICDFGRNQTRYFLPGEKIILNNRFKGYEKDTDFNDEDLYNHILAEMYNLDS